MNASFLSEVERGNPHLWIALCAATGALRKLLFHLKLFSYTQHNTIVEHWIAQHRRSRSVKVSLSSKPTALALQFSQSRHTAQRSFLRWFVYCLCASGPMRNGRSFGIKILPLLFLRRAARTVRTRSRIFKSFSSKCTRRSQATLTKCPDCYLVQRCNFLFWKLCSFMRNSLKYFWRWFRCPKSHNL